MRLSIVIVAYDMAREIPRTLQSLERRYQREVDSLDYEVIVVDNGSPQPLDADSLSCGEVPLTVLRMPQPRPSPAAALNHGIRAARGEYLCLMIDGAHLLTPGALAWTQRSIQAFDRPLVALRYFYLGPGDQPQTTGQGYNRNSEDRLLGLIDWPAAGYRLFEIGAALRGNNDKVTWLNRLFESNCLTLHREQVARLGGMDEAFDLPGGGFVNLDFFKRACELEGSTLVQLVGEGSFHQVHGGTTTNSSAALRAERLRQFSAQYRAIRGSDFQPGQAAQQFLGHLPCEDAKIHRYRHGRLAKSASQDPPGTSAQRS